MKKRTYIEFLRIIACFFVIVTHTNSMVFMELSPSPTWFCSLTAFFVSKTAVPLFLFIMGALLLGKVDSPKKTAQRVLRIAVVLAVSSLLYYAYFAWRYETPFSIKEFVYKLPQTHVTAAFWYIYLYLGLLCLLPVLQRLVKALDKRSMEYFLLLSLGILGTIPLLAPFHLSKYFDAALIGPYIGQVMLGYYIERYVPMTKKVFRGCLCAFAALIALEVGWTFMLYRQDPSSFLVLEDVTIITITGSAACLYICVKYIFTRHPAPPRAEGAICALGALTFGIYLLGDMAINYTVDLYYAMWEHIHMMCAMLLWELVIFALCALVTALLRLVPPLRKWL